MSIAVWSLFFFFQAEDGIRYGRVTGVQTCALPISFVRSPHAHAIIASINTAAAKKSPGVIAVITGAELAQDRKSTRLNSSHPSISYAVFCLKKKKNTKAYKKSTR